MTRHPWVKEAFRAQPEPFLGQLCPEEGVRSLPHVFRLLGPKYMRFRALESKTCSLELGEVKRMLSLKFLRVTFHQFKRRSPWAWRGGRGGRGGRLAGELRMVVLACWPGWGRVHNAAWLCSSSVWTE